MLMVLLSALSVMRHLICDEKTQLVSFDWSNNPDAIDLKMDESS